MAGLQSSSGDLGDTGNYDGFTIDKVNNRVHEIPRNVWERSEYAWPVGAVSLASCLCADSLLSSLACGDCAQES